MTKIRECMQHYFNFSLLQKEERIGSEAINRDQNKEKLVSSCESLNTLGGKPIVIQETDIVFLVKEKEKHISLIKHKCAFLGDFVLMFCFNFTFSNVFELPFKMMSTQFYSNKLIYISWCRVSAVQSTWPITECLTYI